MKPALLLSALRRRARWIVIPIAVVLGYGALAGWLLPWWARPRLEQVLGQALHRSVQIDALAFNPYTLRATLGPLQVREGTQTVLSIRRLDVNLAIASLWRRAPVVQNLTVDAPYLQIRRLDTHRYNWSDLLQGQSGSSGEPQRFAVHNIRISNGRIDFADALLKQQHRLDALALDIPFISNLPVFIETEVQPRLAFRLDGAPLQLQGSTRPFGKHADTRLALTLDGVDLARYWDYLPTPPALRLNKAVLDSRLQLVFRQAGTPTVLLEGQLAAHDVSLDGNGAPLLRMQALQLQLDKLEPLAGRYAIRKLLLQQPEVTLARDGKGALNWLAALQQPVADKPAPAPAKAGLPLQLHIAQFTIEGGALDWADAPAGLHTRLAPIALQVDQLDTTAAQPAKIALSVAGPAIGTLQHTGELQLAARHASGVLNLADAPLAAWAPYYRSLLRSEPLEGTLGGELHYDLALPADGSAAFKLSDSSVQLQQFALRPQRAKAPALAGKTLAVTGIALDLAQRQLGVDKIVLDGLNVDLSRQRDGQWLLASLLPPGDGAQAGPAWQLQLQQLQLAGAAFSGRDDTLPNAVPLGIKSVALQAGPLRWPLTGSTQLKLSGAGAHGGDFAISGGLDLQQLVGKLGIQAKQLDVAYVQPYFSRYLNVSLTSGKLGAKGELQLKGGTPLRVAYNGDFNLTAFNAVDKLSGDDFLRWKSFYLGGIAFNSQPFDLAIKDVALTDFYSRLILTSAGRMNLSDIVVKDQTPVSVTASAPAAAKPAAEQASAVLATAPKTALPPIRIAKVTFSGGNINYTDNFIQPNYTANLTDMAGLLTGLSSVEATSATLDLRGSVDRIAPVNISGQLNPLAKDLFIDIKGGVKGYELTAATPYASKYAGYGIDKGKLSMDVSYHIEGGKLQAQNKILLDQLTLSDKPSGSPDATKLPVKFGLSLLTDRNGQINVQIPVSGTLDDPNFSVGHIVWQAVFNVLTKIITAPFDALAGAFGGGPSFAYVPFQPGSATLDAKHYDPLTKLAEALADRPSLQLEIAGWVNPELDREGLKQDKLDKLIRAAKARSLADSGQASTDELTVDEADYERFIAPVYKQAKFPKPKNVLGLSKSLPVEEMRKLLLANMAITDDDLRQLASHRALAVKDFLKGLGVPDERVFLVKPKVDATQADGDKDKGPSTRAMFTLKH
ncbi:Uncharacterized protein involved in outer membrane biogenesis [Andreprevotia lacus DSM 23236]|jgi:uncharacterized protein involved in outer membrane biogenesis|uniref:Uncharacterized protein involved in outer membrane biogenesis n=1 Tax=Andreprevotia lacus DSM 23236 TaxID=1121001 RepID=A0A1W1XYG6_9NEIS|nr:DUF748 domain-containing protein [Andreprevotia lacus]SMC28601.1 Uncharacterized protein involved in outer membrane biogenesis [Andreprevotia lacus DSM 23236]